MPRAQPATRRSSRSPSDSRWPWPGLPRFRLDTGTDSPHQRRRATTGYVSNTRWYGPGIAGRSDDGVLAVPRPAATGGRDSTSERGSSAAAPDGRATRRDPLGSGRYRSNGGATRSSLVGIRRHAPRSALIRTALVAWAGGAVHRIEPMIRGTRDLRRRGCRPERAAPRDGTRSWSRLGRTSLASSTTRPRSRPTGRPAVYRQRLLRLRGSRATTAARTSSSLADPASRSTARLAEREARPAASCGHLRRRRLRRNIEAVGSGGARDCASACQSLLFMLATSPRSTASEGGQRRTVYVGSTPRSRITPTGNIRELRLRPPERGARRAPTSWLGATGVARSKAHRRIRAGAAAGLARHAADGSLRCGGTATSCDARRDASADRSAVPGLDDTPPARPTAPRSAATRVGG
jgi:hypothetical protein